MVKILQNLNQLSDKYSFFTSLVLALIRAEQFLPLQRFLQQSVLLLQLLNLLPNLALLDVWALIRQQSRLSRVQGFHHRGTASVRPLGPAFAGFSKKLCRLGHTHLLDHHQNYQI